MNQADNTLYDAAASREIDAYAIEHLGVSGYMLMQRAADAAFAGYSSGHGLLWQRQ